MQTIIRLCAVLVIGAAPIGILDQVQGKSGINIECAWEQIQYHGWSNK